MPDLYPVTIDDMIVEVERELAMRHRMYPQWKRKASNGMRARMDRQLEVMTAILEHLEGERSWSNGATTGNDATASRSSGASTDT
jgi:hypothetical protein